MADQVEFTAVGVARGSIYLTLQNIFFTLIGVLGIIHMVRMITLEEMGAIASLIS